MIEDEAKNGEKKKETEKPPKRVEQVVLEKGENALKRRIKNKQQRQQ